ncbi:PH domain-containing protein [Saccharothrix sp. NPDC042600]|uniref:PH domain-containing protein n=1 Tax=Saccharothrix TaxID=2071 RepID=UPI0033D0266D
MGEIRRSRLINYFAATVCALFAGMVPAAELVALPAWAPPWAVSVVVALPLLELMWRSGLRPRVVWNDGGLLIVRPFSASTLRWSEVARVEEEFNRLHVVLAEGGEEVWEFDQAWLWSKLSKSYGARRGRNAALLTTALERGRAVGEVVRPPDRLPRRPLALYSLLLPAAALGQFLVSLGFGA